MASELHRPAPIPNADSRPYWEGCKDKALRYQRCDACGKTQFPPRSHCAHCHRGAMSWHTADGTGVLYSFTVVHRAPTKAFQDVVPYAIGLVDMAEGFRLLLNVQDLPLSELHIGLPVRLRFEQLANGQWIPQAGPA